MALVVCELVDKTFSIKIWKIRDWLSLFWSPGNLAKASEYFWLWMRIFRGPFSKLCSSYYVNSPKSLNLQRSIRHHPILRNPQKTGIWKFNFHEINFIKSQITCTKAMTTHSKKYKQKKKSICDTINWQILFSCKLIYLRKKNLLDGKIIFPWKQSKNKRN